MILILFRNLLKILGYPEVPYKVESKVDSCKGVDNCNRSRRTTV